MIIGIISAIILIMMAYFLRTSMDETLWHEATMFVDGNGNLLIIE